MSARTPRMHCCNYRPITKMHLLQVEISTILSNMLTTNESLADPDSRSSELVYVKQCWENKYKNDTKQQEVWNFKLGRHPIWPHLVINVYKSVW